MNTKTLFVVMAITMLGIAGLAILVSSFSGSSTKATVSKTSGAKIYIDHTSKIVGNIGYSKGILYHSFPIKNVGTDNLEIANIATSCMCTKAFLKTGDNDGPNFGMKGMSAPSSWKGVLKPGEKGEIIAAFDPAYHGPQGTGQVTRSVSFETSDPDNPYVEVMFEGEVIK